MFVLNGNIKIHVHTQKQIEICKHVHTCIHDNVEKEVVFFRKYLHYTYAYFV